MNRKKPEHCEQIRSLINLTFMEFDLFAVITKTQIVISNALCACRRKSTNEMNGARNPPTDSTATSHTYSEPDTVGSHYSVVSWFPLDESPNKPTANTAEEYPVYQATSNASTPAVYSVARRQRPERGGVTPSAPPDRTSDNDITLVDNDLYE